MKNLAKLLVILSIFLLGTSDVVGQTFDNIASRLAGKN